MKTTATDEFSVSTRKNATVNGLRLNYQLFAALSLREADPLSLPPIVMLHGWPQTSHVWHRIAPQLAASGRVVIVPDLGGAGDSEQAEDGYDT